MDAIIPVFTNGGHAMSESGDVVWSDGRAWQRGRYGSARGVKAWWVNPAVGTATLEELRHADDFRWLVRDGIPIVLNALAVYQALDSFADFVAKRDADAELTAERDALLSRLAEMTAQRDRAVAKGSELAADLVESERQHDEARDEERAAIVAWLRTGAGRIDRPNRFVLADGIEFRHHLRGDDE